MNGKTIRFMICILLCTLTILVGVLSVVAMPVNMDGEYIHIEAEDMVHSSSATVNEVATASGGKVLLISGNGVTAAEDLNESPSCMASFNVNKSSQYIIWLRVKTESDGTTLLYDTDGNGNIKSKNIKYTSFSWCALEKRMYSAGYKEIHISSSADLYIDGIVITSDMSYHPVSSVPATPDTSYVSDYFPIDSVKIFPEKGKHPRLFFTEADIPAIKEKLNDSFFKTDVQHIYATGNTDIDCILPAESASYTNYVSYVEILTNRAFLYAIGVVDEEHADKTVAEMKNFISTVSFDGYNSTDESRYMGSTMVMASCVYDWCYDRLTYADKQFVIRKLKEMAAETEVGNPATKRSYVISHAIEGLIYKDQLAVGIAIYDEEPDWYNTVAAIIFDKMLPVKNFLNSSGHDASGSSYAESRNDGAVNTSYMFDALGLEENIFADNYNDVFRTWIYTRLPNGFYFKDGDDYGWGNAKANDTRSTLFSWINNYVGSKYDDPYILRQAYLDYIWSGSSHSVTTMLSLDREAELKETTELPLTHFTTYPISSMTARTSWQNGLNAPTAMAYVNMREVTIGDHQHRDVGGFQLYYKGMLALDSGLYEWTDHYYDYQSRSIAHNVLLVHDPDEVFNTSDVNDGGQKVPANFGFGASQQHLAHVEASIESGDCITAKDTVYYAGPDEYRPEFSYISADIKPAYTDKVSAYERSTVFVNTDNEDYPALFVVYDNVASSDASFKKTWLLHGEEEPVVDDNRITLTRTADGYNGKLVNTTLVPSLDNSVFTIVGGEGNEFSVNGVNYPVETYKEGNHSDMGKWRVELSPLKQSTDDIFLNAMYVTDADSSAPELEIYKEENEHLYGVTTLDKAVYFSKDRDGIATSFELPIRDNGYDTTDCFVSGLASGKWNITGKSAAVKSYGIEDFEDTTYTYTLNTSANIGVTDIPASTGRTGKAYGLTAMGSNNNGQIKIAIPSPYLAEGTCVDIEFDAYLTGSFSNIQIYYKDLDNNAAWSGLVGYGNPVPTQNAPYNALCGQWITLKLTVDTADNCVYIYHNGELIGTKNGLTMNGIKELILSPKTSNQTREDFMYVDNVEFSSYAKGAELTASYVVEVKEDEECFALSLPSGTYTVTPAPENAVVTQLERILSAKEDFGDFLIKKNNNLMYLPKPTKLIDGVPYVAVDGIFTQLGADIISSTTDSVTFKIGEDVVAVVSGSNSYTLNGTLTPAKHSAISVNDEIYCAFEDYSSLLGASNVTYNAVAKLLRFSR